MNCLQRICHLGSPRDGSHPCDRQNSAKSPTMVDIHRVHLGANGTGHTHATGKTVQSSYNGAYDSQHSCYGYSIFETAPRPDTPHGQCHDPFLSRCEQGSHSLGGMWAMTSPRLALHNGLMQDLPSIKEVPDNLLPDMTRWRTEESLGCMTTWSQDRSSPGHLLSGSVRTAVSHLRGNVSTPVPGSKSRTRVQHVST